jgi:hypothetical protein
MDFLRKVALFKGRLLFVEEDLGYDQMTGKLAETMLMSLSVVFQTTTYETYTLIKSQNLFFRIETSRLVEISLFSQLTASVNEYLVTYPQFSCVCGACTIILKRRHATYQNMQIVACRCCSYY